MLKPPVPKFCPDLSARLKDIAEKQVPVKLKPIVDPRLQRELHTASKFIHSMSNANIVVIE